MVSEEPAPGWPWTQGYPDLLAPAGNAVGQHASHLKTDWVNDLRKRPEAKLYLAKIYWKEMMVVSISLLEWAHNGRCEREEKQVSHLLKFSPFFRLWRQVDFRIAQRPRHASWGCPKIIKLPVGGQRWGKSWDPRTPSAPLWVVKGNCSLGFWLLRKYSFHMPLADLYYFC